MQPSHNILGAILLGGGFCVHLALGTFYLWGNISLYLASYLKQFDDNVTSSSLAVVFPFCGLLINIGLAIGPNLARHIPQLTLVWISAIAFPITILISSFCTTQFFFILFYSIFGALFLGIAYLPPISMGWNHFPNRRGMVSGIILAGFGVSPFLFNFVSKLLINPNDIQANVVHPDPDGVTFGLRVLALCWAICFILGAAILTIYRKTQQRSGNLAETFTQSTTTEQDKEEVSAGFKSKEIYLLFFSFIFCVAPYFFFMANYKNYGLKIGHPDSFLTVVGSFASLSNGVFRTLWSSLLDYFTYKRVFIPMIIGQVTLVLTFNSIADTQGWYFIWVLFIAIIGGGYFSIFPTITSKIYGTKAGSKLYGFVFFATSFGNFIQYFTNVIFIDKWKVPYTDLFQFFGIFTAFSVITSFMVQEFRPEKTITSLSEE
eukprot:TRINITY_DN3714_c0_g1_i13.p1 TRINITY_DN3714_c0_g1~~TRINITY_DN3714_c0_g1_i13.p1  ORF type:complete len:432 (-),score=83.01 TRINITY_DN3714_c0_g1_i13:163-1458(-)